MKIDVTQLDKFIRCPRIMHEPVIKSPEEHIIETCISIMHRHFYTRGEEISWKKIISKVNSMYIKTYPDDKNFRKGVEAILLFLSRWRHAILGISPSNSYFNINLEWEMGQHTLTGNIPILIVSDKLHVGTFATETDYHLSSARSYYLASLALLAARSLDISDVTIHYIIWKNLTIPPEVKLFPANIFRLNRMEDTVRDIVYSIGAGLKYPTPGPHCETCKISSTCRI